MVGFSVIVFILLFAAGPSQLLGLSPVNPDK